MNIDVNKIWDAVKQDVTEGYRIFVEELERGYESVEEVIDTVGDVIDWAYDETYNGMLKCVRWWEDGLMDLNCVFVTYTREGFIYLKYFCAQSVNMAIQIGSQHAEYTLNIVKNALLNIGIEMTTELLEYLYRDCSDHNFTVEIDRNGNISLSKEDIQFLIDWLLRIEYAPMLGLTTIEQNVIAPDFNGGLHGTSALIKAFYTCLDNAPYLMKCDEIDGHYITDFSDHFLDIIDELSLNDDFINAVAQHENTFANCSIEMGTTSSSGNTRFKEITINGGLSYTTHNYVVSQGTHTDGTPCTLIAVPYTGGICSFGLKITRVGLNNYRVDSKRVVVNVTPETPVGTPVQNKGGFDIITTGLGTTAPNTMYRAQFVSIPYKVTNDIDEIQPTWKNNPNPDIPDPVYNYPTPDTPYNPLTPIRTPNHITEPLPIIPYTPPQPIPPEPLPPEPPTPTPPTPVVIPVDEPKPIKPPTNNDIPTATPPWVHIYNPADRELSDFSESLWSDTIMEKLKKWWSNNPMDGVLTLKKIHLPSSTNKGSANIVLGAYDSGITVATVPRIAVFNFIEPSNAWTIDGIYNDYRDYFCTASIYIPCCGTYELDIKDIMYSSLYLTSIYDVLTGDMVVHLMIKKDGWSDYVDLYQYNGNMATEYPLSSGTRDGLMSGLIGGTVGTVSTIAQGLSGNVVGAVASGISTVSSVASSIGRNIQRTGSIGGIGSELCVRYPFIIIKCPHSFNNNETDVIKGVRTNVTATVSECSGMTRFKDIHIDIPMATNTEKNEIESLLKSGIYC